MLDNLLPIRAAIITAETGSFSETGRRLGVGHSVISKRIGQLEWELRRKLFTRSTRRVVLTEFGRLHLPKLVRIVREYDELLAGTMPYASELVGHLSVKCPANDSLSISLRSLIVSFIGQNPSLTMNAVFVDRIVNPADEAFDIALTIMPTTFDGVSEIPLCPFERIPCASSDYIDRHGAPATLEDLTRHNCIVFGPMGGQWTLESPKGVSTISVKSHIRTNDSQLVLELARGGEGVAVLPAARIEEDLATGRLLRVLPDFTCPKIWLKGLVPRQRLNAPAVQALLKHIQQAFGAA